MFSSIDDLYEHPSGGGPLNYNVTKNWYASKKHFNRAPDAFIDIFSSKHHFNPYKNLYRMQHKKTDAKPVRK
jgi:hypothetical protein